MVLLHHRLPGDHILTRVAFIMGLREIASRSAISLSRIEAWSNLKKQSDLCVKVFRVGTSSHVQEISQALGDDLEGKKAISK
jgi:hypothetical protein